MPSCAISITYMSLVPMVLKNLERGLKAKFDDLSRAQAFHAGSHDRDQQDAYRARARMSKLSRKLLRQVHQAFGGELLRYVYGRRIHGAVDAAVFLRSRNSGGQWLRAHRSRHRADRE